MWLWGHGARCSGNGQRGWEGTERSCGLLRLWGGVWANLPPRDGVSRAAKHFVKSLGMQSHEVLLGRGFPMGFFGAL